MRFGLAESCSRSSHEPDEKVRNNNKNLCKSGIVHLMIMILTNTIPNGKKLIHLLSQHNHKPLRLRHHEINEVQKKQTLRVIITTLIICMAVKTILNKSTDICLLLLQLVQIVQIVQIITQHLNRQQEQLLLQIQPDDRETIVNTYRMFLRTLLATL